MQRGGRACWAWERALMRLHACRQAWGTACRRLAQLAVPARSGLTATRWHCCVWLCRALLMKEALEEINKTKRQR